jgi:hypothetical protein
LDIERVIRNSVDEGAGNSSLERLIVRSVRARIDRSDLAEWPESRVGVYLRSRFRTRECGEGIVLLGIAPRR